ncbi:Pentapeptide repeats (8 copies) [Legionella brunensis]|uniref:Pentapeptide repeats (8 copies) n=2 Tax=Legionella brunensis TaxID=29422 RepID=A0A0W0SEC7_9GAMM|nr:Pentapeptide repeats (8 copies) [Legionella brunensis]
MTTFNLNRYAEETFSQLILEETRVDHIEFQSCQFKECKFLGVTFSKVKFIDCDFESCDLSLSKFPGCKFSEVSFKHSKLAGINWTELSWPLVKLTSPLYFYESNLSHSSFFGLTLDDLIMEGCKVHNVDFREANLNYASFVGTDLQNSLFMHTNLKHADFTNSTNYGIDTQCNTVTKAKFLFPDVIALLNHLDIKINGWPNDDET